jgi:hypothetical protein
MAKERPGVYAGSKIPYTLHPGGDAIKEKLSREGYVWTSNTDTEKETTSTL